MAPPIESPNRRARTQLWMLIAVFFAPLVAAFALYYGAQGWRPSGQTNHGDLIDPVRPLPQLALPALEGGKLDEQILQGKWTLVYVGAGSCDARCREALVLMRQTRLALSDEMARVQRLFLATQECCDREYLQVDQPGLLVVPGETPEAQALLAQFPVWGGVPVADAGRIYIVDPLGNLMMSHAPEAPPKGLLLDLKKLLKLSHIG